MTFGEMLRDLRAERGYSLRALAALAHCSHQRIRELELGRGRPSPRLAAGLDAALGAGGTLEAAAQVQEDDMRRRTLIQSLGAAGLAAPLATADSVRQALTEAVAGDKVGTDPDGWSEVAAEYGFAFYTRDPTELLRDLTADLAALHRQATRSKPSRRGPLYRAAGQLAAVCAMALASAGEVRQARHWWRTARKAADASTDVATRMWVRGWEVADGLYEQRPIRVILDRAAESVAVGGQSMCAGSAGMYAGLAQTLAVAGRRADAVAALRKVATITERLPAAVTDDDDSMFGWPEVRLRHTESFVFTALGETTTAYEAQDRALELYPVTLLRERAAMLLHRATCMVRDGDVGGGLVFAAGILDGLPDGHRTELVHAIGRQTLAAVPITEKSRPEAVELAGRLAKAGGVT